MIPTILQPIITLKICKSFFWMDSAEPNPWNYLQWYRSFDTFLGFKTSGTLITVADKVPMPTPHLYIQPVWGDKHTWYIRINVNVMYICIHLMFFPRLFFVKIGLFNFMCHSILSLLTILVHGNIAGGWNKL